MPRLYQSIFLTVLASLVAVVVVAGAVWRFGNQEGPLGDNASFAAEFVAAALPDATASPDEQQSAVARLSARVRADITLFDAARRPIAVAGRAAKPPGPRAPAFGFTGDRNGGAWMVELPDGRWLVARLPARHRGPLVGLLILLGAIAGVVALCAFPVVRWLTRRLETLQRGVDRFGAGDLSARVAVKGRDEVARLATSFNAAAARIETLVRAHTMLLANASHELRTPLARLRLAIELFQTTGETRYRSAAETDLRELDGIIDEILLASRLEAQERPIDREPVDLLAIAAEEAARFDAVDLDGAEAQLHGDARLLRRLVRNLLENARRHGKPPTHLMIHAFADRIVLDVADQGAPIPSDARERVFEPFTQLRADAQGSGLGLALVRRIARLHGGDATIAERDGRTVFRVMLPRDFSR